MRKCLFIGILATWHFTGMAQSVQVDSVMTIEGVSIHSSRIVTFGMGQKLISFDSITRIHYQDRSLAGLIKSHTSIQIKTYNYNGLSTIAFRGTSAQHTGIYWNGIQLNPSNSGLLDLTLVPAGFFNSLRLMYGGGSSLFGSGNIGGSIHLGNNPEFVKKNTLKVHLGMGSFGEYQMSGVYSKSNAGYSTKTSLLYRKAKNDFPFRNLSGERVLQTNSAISGIGLMHDFYKKVNKGQWGAHLWLQDNHREIPASLTSAPSNVEQTDRSARATVSLEKAIRRAMLKIQAAASYDYFQYIDPGINSASLINSRIETLKYTAEAVYSRTLPGNFQFKTGMNEQLETGNSDNWNGEVRRNQVGLFAFFMHPIPRMKWKAHLNLRKDFNSNYRIPFSPSFGAEGKLFGKWSGRMSISKNFRIPTFNDLFWVPGGNPDIQPEDSWNQEFGVKYTKSDDSLGLSYGLNAGFFSSQVKNWIIWVPKGSYSEPQNIQEVRARGIEAGASAGFRIARFKVTTSGGYTYSRSTGVKKRWAFDEAYQKQLIYVPEHRFTGKLILNFSKYSLSYNHSYTGLQYTTSDNLEFLPAFQTGDVFLDVAFLLNHHQLMLQLQARNIWNAEYQSVVNYPNPGRSFYFSVTYQIQSK